MKVLILELGDKKYTSSHITAYISKEAMKLNRDAIELGKLGEQAQEKPDTETAGRLMDSMIDLADRKTNLICEVYGNKFTAEDLDKNLSTEEIDEEIQKIILGISGVISKN